MRKLTMQDVVTAQKKRRKGEPYPESMTLEEIDFLISRVQVLEEELSTVHTDRILEQYKAFAAPAEGRKSLED